MERDKKQVRRPANLGITDFETVEDTQERQDDMLRRLGHVIADPGQLAGLTDCDLKHCGRIQCSEVCQFGTRRRRKQEVVAIHRLLTEAGGPYCEVRVGRGVWAQPLGRLDSVSIEAAMKLGRRALDSLSFPELIAVGTFKVSVAAQHEGSGWKCELHLVAAGAKKRELTDSFGTSRSNLGNFLRVQKVRHLGQTISEVLKRGIHGWQHPFRSEIDPSRPKKAQRKEYYRWLLTLSPGERMFRYGCDRYFNVLHKQPRSVDHKIEKGHPSPTWLAPFQFGSHSPTCQCSRCQGDFPLN